MRRRFTRRDFVRTGAAAGLAVAAPRGLMGKAPAVQTGSGTVLTGLLALACCGAVGGRTVTPGQAAWSRVSSA